MDLEGFEKFKAIAEKGRGMKVDVGIFPERNKRSDGMTNAEIGLKHEFGDPLERLPERSFLRAPLILFLGQAIQAVGPNTWFQIMEKKGIKGALEELGFLSVETINEAFETGGYGTWKPLSEWTRLVKTLKGSPAPSKILVDTGELQTAIDYKVVQKK